MDYQAIMSLAFKDRTYEEITASVGCSRRDVSAVKKAITTAGITAEHFASMTAGGHPEVLPRRAQDRFPGLCATRILPRLSRR